jgi:hypothetical protein
MRPPLVRAGVLQGAVAASSDVAARLQPSTVAAIDRARRRAWVPMALDLELAEAVARVFPDDDARRAFWRRTRSAAYRDWLFGPLAGAAFRALVKPPTLVRFAPRIWVRVFKNAGRLDVEQQGRAGAVLALRDAAPAMIGSPVYLAAVAASIEGGLEATGAEGGVVIADVDVEGRKATFRATWKPERGPRAPVG